MKLIIVNEKMEILSNVYLGASDAIRVPVKGDYIFYYLTQKTQKLGEIAPIQERIVDKVQLDYTKNLAVVTVTS